MIDRDEFVALQAQGYPEAALENNVRQAALTNGWLYYHTHDSRRSDPGFLDCVLVRDGRVKWRELKKQKEKVTREQQQWIDRLEAAGQDVAVWRPADWFSGRILEELE